MTPTNNDSMFNYYSIMSNSNRSFSANNPALIKDEVDNAIHMGYYYYVGSTPADSSDRLRYDGFIGAQLFNNFTPDINNTTTAGGDGITFIASTDHLHPTLAGHNGASQTQKVGSSCLLLILVTDGNQARYPGNIASNPSCDSGTKGDRVAFELQPMRLAPVKAAFNQAQSGQTGRFEGAARLFTLPMKTNTQAHPIDLIPTLYLLPQPSRRRSSRLSVSYLDDDWGHDVVDDFSPIQIRADMTLAKGNDLIWTFLYNRVAIRADETFRFHLLILDK